MRGELIAIDLETTGLDVESDRIIEIGVVLMEEGEVISEYSTFVNPHTKIPERTTLLTGIHQHDVQNAPDIDDVLPKLLAFVGDRPIIGHSVGFDMAFMNKHGVFTSNTPLDTYDLASVLMPRAPRYNLHSLTQDAGIALEDAHRALDDARAAGLLYWQLYQWALDLPVKTIKEICDAAQGIDWYAEPTFQAALAERVKSESAPYQDDRTAQPQDTVSHLRPLKPNQDVIELDVDQIAEMFGRQGELAEQLPNFEYRPQQEEMARIIAEAFNENKHAMVEAGTGTGKSLAYLLPAFEWAALNNERVVISTNTISLQDQLIKKDIPALQDALGIHLNAAVLKGRSNYLCPLRVEAMKRRGPTNVEELRVLAKILVWQLGTNSGDKTEISLRGGAEHSIWHRLSSAESDGCRSNACSHDLGVECPFYRAYKRAESAHLLIVNHALLVADAKADNNVLPDYEYIIIDEGHHLEDAVTNSMSFTIDEFGLKRRLEELSDDRRGLLSDMVTALKASNTPAKTVSSLESFAKSVNQAANDMRNHVGGLFNATRTLVENQANTNSNYSINIRLDDNLRDKSDFDRIRARWHILQDFMEAISDATSLLSERIGGLEEYDIENYNDILRSTRTVARYFQETRESLHGFFEDPDANVIYWIAASSDGRRVSLRTAPLHVGPHVTETLWNRRRSVVMTSATLRTNDSFDYLQKRVHGEIAETHEVGSPFNYKESTLLYLPTDVPEPNERVMYQQCIEQAIADLAVALNGRVMALFTSYNQLRQTSRTITDPLAARNITVYDQSDGTSRQSLLDGFKSTERAVLLGTRSFWEGVDIPGNDLSALVITRLPFPVPSDPIFSARAATYKNHFNEYTIPEAILQFRQGFGRLIRRQTDRGVVVVLDTRITSKSYGSAFLDALPECTIKQAALTSLATEAKAWLTETN